MNTRYAEKRTRSANDPVISAGVMTANFNWNIANSASGIVGARSGCVAAPTPRNMKNVNGIADQAVVALAEREAEAERHPDQADHARGR